MLKAFLSMACLVLLFGCSDGVDAPEQSVSPAIRIGISESFFAAPMVIATATGAFSKRNLEAEIHKFQSGKKALEALLAGKVDVASVADMPLMKTAFERDDFAVLATFSRSSNQGKIVALNSAAVSPVDLVGKKIGVARYTTADYYLHAFLNYHNIDASNVQIVSKTTSELAEALSTGQVDAIATWEPYVTQAINLLGKDRVTEFYMTNVARVTFNLVAMKRTIQQRPDDLKRVIQAVGDSVALIHEKRPQAIQVLASELNTDSAVVLKNLPDYQMYIGLDQGLIYVFENQAEWYMNDLGLEGQIPNFLDIVHADLLYDVYPDTVTLIQ